MKGDCTKLIAQLITRGDHLAIDGGRLELKTASGNAVPTDWLHKNRESLIQAILQITGVDGFIYTGYTTGRYQVNRNKRSDGITLNFVSLTSGEAVYAIFNVSLKRQRTTPYGKKGDPLPAGEFRISTRYGLYKFWVATGLALPKRIASLSEYLGNMKQLIFACELITDHPRKQGRIDTRQGIRPLSITPDQIQLALNTNQHLTDNSRATDGQLTDNSRTKVTDKTLQQDHKQKGFQPIPTTSHSKYETSYQGNTSNGMGAPGFCSPIPVDEQTEQEWVDRLGPDYGNE